VGYDNITRTISNAEPLSFVAMLALLKFVSWSISLGSGTSGGTLAPLFTIGGGMGALLGAGAVWMFPGAAVDVRIAALVGMAAIFAGASRALLASVVFAFETTLQPLGLLPLLGGCTAAYFVSALLMRQTIMTEKIARRGIRVPSEYTPDFLGQVLVRDAMTSPPVTLRGSETVERARAWVASGGGGASHQGFPVVDDAGHLLGVLTRKDLDRAGAEASAPVSGLIRRPPVVVYSDCTLREAADHMVNHGVGRLPVLDRENPSRVVGVITRSDLLSAHRRRLDETHVPERSLELRTLATPPWRLGAKR
jgi:chloride channel protein, CIC family